MILNKISSFGTEYERVLRHVIWETNSGPRVFLRRLSLRVSLGRLSGYLFSLGAVTGHYQSKNMLLKICIRREFLSQTVIFF